MTTDELVDRLQRTYRVDESIKNYEVIVRYEGEELRIKGPILVSTSRQVIICLRQDHATR